MPRKPIIWATYECPTCKNTVQLNAAIQASVSCGRCVGRKAKPMTRKDT